MTVAGRLRVALKSGGGGIRRGKDRPPRQPRFFNLISGPGALLLESWNGKVSRNSFEDKKPRTVENAATSQRHQETL